MMKPRQINIPFEDDFLPNPLKFTDENGIITSSNYPNDYNPNEKCGFLIEGPPGSRLVHHNSIQVLFHTTYLLLISFKKQ